METLLHINDKKFSPLVFPKTKDGFREKIEFFIIVTVFSLLLSWIIKETFFSNNELNQQNIIYIYGLIGIITYPIIFKNIKIYKRFFLNIIFHKKIRKIKYHHYLSDKKLNIIINALNNDKSLSENNKKVILEHLSSRMIINIISNNQNSR